MDNQSHYSVLVDSLESRVLFSAAYPSADEQYLIELINRARANPAAEASRLGIGLNEGLTPGTISTLAKQPLAINAQLMYSAGTQSTYVLSTDVLSHTGSGRSTPAERMAKAGYEFTGRTVALEDIGWTPQQFHPTQAIAQLYKDMFIDHYVSNSRAHRLVLMDVLSGDIGVGVVAGNFKGSKVVMGTMDLARSDSSGVFLTGVAYNDAITHDQFYNPGEGLGGVTVTAKRLSDQKTFTMKTWASGGYSLKLEPGTYAVTASGGGLANVTAGNVVIGNRNVKQDFTPALPPVSPPAPPPPPVTSDEVEQYLVELINRARANPAAEAARLGIDLNEGLAAGTISTDARSPLAINGLLATAAAGQTNWMIQNNLLSHGGANGSDPFTRITAAGYELNLPYSYGENIAWSGKYPQTPDRIAAADDLQRQLFLGASSPDRSQRTNILAADFKEVGLGVSFGTFQSYNAEVVTENFASTGAGSFLTGVAYTDAKTHDHFYTPGEELAGVEVTAVRKSDGASFSTTTQAGGGYSMQLNPGEYSVTAANLGIAAQEIVIDAQNVKVDFVPTAPSGGNVGDGKSPSAKISASKVKKARKNYTFEVRYSDADGVDPASLGNGDVVVTGPHHFKRIAKLVGVHSTTDGTARVATYRIKAPGGGWDAGDNGMYTVSVRSHQVRDNLNHFVAARSVGKFSVQLVAAKNRG